MNAFRDIVPFAYRHSRAIIAVVLALFALYLCVPTTEQSRKPSSSAAGPPMLQRPPSLYGFSGEDSPAAATTNDSNFSAYGLAKCVPDPFIPSLRVLTEAAPPRRRPQHVQRVLDEINALGLESYTKKKPLDGINSTPLGEEDVARAEAHWIEELPPAPTGADPNKACFGGGGKAKPATTTTAFRDQSPADLEARALSQLVYNQLRHSVQRRLIDATPMVLDVGCVVGETYARHNPRATVLCLHLSRRFSTKPSHVDVPANLFHLFPPAHIAAAVAGASNDTEMSLKAILDEQFKPFFQMCNFFTLVFVLGNLREDLARPTAELLPLLERLLPMSALLYAAVPGADEGSFAAERFLTQPPARSYDPLAPFDLVDPSSMDRLSDATVGVAVASRVPASLQPQLLQQNHQRTSSSPSVLARSVAIKAYALGRSLRPCIKFWDGRFLQIGRSPSIAFDERGVSIVIRRIYGLSGLIDGLLFYAKYVQRSLTAGLSALVGYGGSPFVVSPIAARPIRRIHPLQYLASISFETMLHLGVDDGTRLQMFGDMVASPRYLDPLPHNWVVTEGRVVRIDKTDDALEESMQESRHAWSNSTAGYLGYLASHLCLPATAPTPTPDIGGGLLLPSPFLRLGRAVAADGSGEQCSAVCRRCVERCSYLPRGVLCDDCARCGDKCVRPLGQRLRGEALAAEAFPHPYNCARVRV